MNGWIIAGVFLLIGSMFDIRERKVPVWLLTIGLICGLGIEIMNVITNSIFWWGWITDSLPGIFALMVALITREQVGYGDGWILLFLGWLAGCKSIVMITAWALGICFVISMILLISKRGGRNTQIPFIPLLFIGYLIVFGSRFL